MIVIVEVTILTINIMLNDKLKTTLSTKFSGGLGWGWKADHKICIQGKMHTIFLLRSKPCPPRQFTEVVHLKVRECYPYTDET